MTAYSSEPTFNTQKNSRIGTKGELRTWLSSMKNMTYTKYTTLAPDKKAEIMKEYKEKLQTNRSTVIVKAAKQENTNVL